MIEHHMIVADDDRELSDILRICGEGLGFKVHTAATGDAFKSCMTECDPSVIVLDIVMPDTDGNQLLMWLIERGETAPIIVMTGYDGQYIDTATLIARTGGLNMLGTLNKPFSLDELETLIKPLLDA